MAVGRRDIARDVEERLGTEPVEVRIISERQWWLITSRCHSVALVEVLEHLALYELGRGHVRFNEVQLDEPIEKLGPETLFLEVAEDIVPASGLQEEAIVLPVLERSEFLLAQTLSGNLDERQSLSLWHHRQNTDARTTQVGATNSVCRTRSRPISPVWLGQCCRDAEAAIQRGSKTEVIGARTDFDREGRLVAFLPSEPLEHELSRGRISLKTQPRGAGSYSHR